MINIANLLLTRRCNLKCSYCRISYFGGNVYKDKPNEYPDFSYYLQNEKSPQWWIGVIDKLYEENPKTFFILYGGEPFLYEGLADIVSHMNERDMAYTIISNSTNALDTHRKKFFRKVKKIRGYTASVDPLYGGMNVDIIKKSSSGIRVMKELMDEGLADDVVAEITCDRKSIMKVEDTIKFLSEELGVCSDLTVIDIAKNPYYDFSSVTDSKLLVPKTHEVREVFDRLIESNYNIHMKNTLLEAIWNFLPSDLDCKLGSGNFHNVTVDSDGRIRLCLRIRGRIPFDATDLFVGEERRSEIEFWIGMEKKHLCQRCSWTCARMSQNDIADSIINH